MRLKDDYIQKIQGNAGLRKALLAALGIHRGTLNDHLRENKEDGPLTKMKPLKEIAGHYNVSVEDIVEPITHAA